MNLLKNIAKLGEVQNFLERHSGKLGQDIIGIYCEKNRPLKDEYLAKRLNLKVTDVRSGLNRLHYLGISYYQKEKNKDTGWYSFTWKIDEKRLIELICQDFGEKVQNLEKKEEKNETYTLFSCKNNCDEIPFELASEYQFRCPNCGNVMNLVDTKKMLLGIRKNMAKVKENLGILNKVNDDNTQKIGQKKESKPKEKKPKI